MVVSVQSGAGRPILSPLESAADWSRDGASVLYTFTSNGRSDIGLLNLSDGKTRRLTATPDDEYGAQFTADGKTVLFRRGNSVTRIYTVDLTKLLAGAR